MAVFFAVIIERADLEYRSSITMTCWLSILERCYRAKTSMAKKFSDCDGGNIYSERFRL